MGTWNYGKSGAICTLGYQYWDEPDEQEVTDFMYVNDVEDETEAKKMIEENHQDITYQDFEGVKALLEKFDSTYYSLTVRSGYYEGFWIDIQKETTIDVKADPIEELNQIRSILVLCIRKYNMRVHYAGWCVGWEDTETQSIDKVDELITKEKEKWQKKTKE